MHRSKSHAPWESLGLPVCRYVAGCQAPRRVRLAPHTSLAACLFKGLILAILNQSQNCTGCLCCWHSTDCIRSGVLHSRGLPHAYALTVLSHPTRVHTRTAWMPRSGMRCSSAGSLRVRQSRAHCKVASQRSTPAARKSARVQRSLGHHWPGVQHARGRQLGGRLRGQPPHTGSLRRHVILDKHSGCKAAGAARAAVLLLPSSERSSGTSAVIAAQPCAAQHVAFTGGTQLPSHVRSVNKRLCLLRTGTWRRGRHSGAGGQPARRGGGWAGGICSGAAAAAPAKEIADLHGGPRVMQGCDDVAARQLT